MTAHGAGWSCRSPAPTPRPGPSGATTRRQPVEPDSARSLHPGRCGLRAALRTQAAVHGACRDDAAALRGAGPHVRHRHADDGGAARAVRESVARRVHLRLAADAVVSVSRAHDRRAGDGRVHHAHRRRPADDPDDLSGHGERRPGARQPVVLGARVVAALRLCQLRAGRHAGRDVPAAVHRDQEEAPRRTSTSACPRCSRSTR